MNQEENYIRIAVICDAHALKGWFKIFVTSDIPERFNAAHPIYLRTNDSCRQFSIISYIPQKKSYALLKLEGIDDRTNALLYKGIEIFIKQAFAEEIRPLLDKESYFYFDLIGCDVLYKGSIFGTITEILEAGSGEILIITNGEGKEFMVPFVESMVDTRDILEKRITITPVEGLFDI